MQTGAEDPNKVKKLVETPGMKDLWDKMYASTLGDLQSTGLISVLDIASEATKANHGRGRKNVEYNITDVAARRQLVQNLPPRFGHIADEIVGTDDNKDSIQRGGLVLRQELAEIVAPAAKSQGAKGFFTAGVSKSWKYALAKFAKGRLRK